MNESPQKSTGLRKQLKRFECGCEWEVALNDDGDIVGINYEPELANIHCKKVWELLASGLTKGIFQLETPLGQSTTKACQPYGIEELSDIMAIVRPGTADAELDGKTLKQRYIDRKNGLENPDPLHPKLGDMLMPTQNIGVYQESYLTISKELAGFTAEESVAFLKCISGDSILMTRSGPQKIKDLYKNCRGQVLSVNKNGKHEYVKLTKVWKSGVKKTFRVWTNKGFFIDCTEDHQLFTQNGWKQVKDINLHKDSLAITNSYNGNSVKKNIINENLSILLSYVISEGSYVKSNITIVNKNEWVIDKLKNILNTEFGSDSYRTYIHKTTGCTTFLLRKNSSAFIRKYLKPAKSRYKKIPNVIVKNLKSVITAFIGSYFNAEGSVGNHNIDFSSTSFDIIRVIQILLLKYNIHSSVSIKNGIYNGLPYLSYRLYISDPHDIYRFRNIFKDYIQEDKMSKMCLINSKEYSNSRFLVPSGYMRAISNSIQDMNSVLGTPDGTIYGKNITYDKAHRYQQFLKSELLQEILDADYKFTKVTRIEELKEEEVYDFSVDGETHCCFVNGILTHNCVSKKQTDKMVQFKDKFIAGCIKSGLSEQEAQDIFDIMEAGQRYAFNKCLDPLTEVKTLQGNKTLEDIKVGSFVLDHKDRYVKVLNKYYNGKKQTYLYTFQSGKTLRCTPDHKILVDSQLLRIKDVFNSGQMVGADFIISATDEKYIDTIDIEVCNEDHVFMANGIAVSNSHSISYAYDALYFSAYAKSHFPKAFFLAELVAAKSIEEIGEVIDDSLNFKVEICKPDLRLLNDEFTLSNRCIQYGLGRIKGVGESKLAKLKAAIDGRDVSKMRWLELLGCLAKTSSDAALSLIYSGALDFTLLTRSRMMFELAIFNRLTEKQQDYIVESNSLLSGLTSIVDMGSGKSTLCYNSASLKKANTILNELNSPPFSLKDSRDQIFNWEIQHLGYAFTTTEVDESLSNCTCEDFNNGKQLKEYIIGGTVVRIKVIETKGKQPGQEMAFVEFKDSTNKVSGVAFPQVWIENSSKIYEGNKLMFFGTLGKKNSFVINRVMQL